MSVHVFNRKMLSLFLLIWLPWASASGAPPAPLFSVPMTVAPNGHVVVEARINDRWDVPMVVDTGAHVAVVPVAAVEALELNPWAINRAQVTTPSEVRTMEDVLLQSIQVGRGRLERVPSVLADVPIPGKTEAVGVLPSLFLRNFTVHFDLAAKRLEFFSADLQLNTVLDAQRYSAVPFDIENNFIVFPLQLEQHSVPTVLDTGGSGAPVVNWSSARLLQLEPGSPILTKGRAVQGLGSKALPASRYTASDIRIGDELLPNRTIDIADMLHIQSLMDGGPGANLGLLSLGTVSLYISYSSQQLYLDIPSEAEARGQ